MIKVQKSKLIKIIRYRRQTDDRRQMKLRSNTHGCELTNETLTIEIMNKTTKNIIVSTCYRPPAAKIKPFKQHLIHIFEKLARENKKLFIVGDFNINSLNYSTNSKVKRFIDYMFSKGSLSVINRPTRITKTSISCIDHIYVNSYYNQDILSGIIKTDLSDHFPIFIIDNSLKTTNFPDKITKQIRKINKKSISEFKTKLLETDWSFVLEISNSDHAYDIFLKQFLKMYNTCFPTRTVEIKRKNLLSPWITRGIIKSSKQKQKLYIKYLKNKSYRNEQRYKQYKHLFEKIKKNSKKNHFSRLLFLHKNNAKKTWDTIKEAIGKSKIKGNKFPKFMSINKKEIFDKNCIANSFNDYFVNIGSNLAAKIPSSEKHFSAYLQQTNKILVNEELTMEEFESAFNSIKKNKACGFDEINPNVIKSSFNELVVPIFHIFKLSLKTGCFPDKLKIAKITPLFKSGETDLLNNYRPISVLPVFSKILERIMYNRVYKHISDNSLLYEKQFGFQKECSTEHAILQLAKEIYESFDKKQFTLGVFLDLSKAFDTVNHDILLNKLTSFGIQGSYIDWFKSYLYNRQQYISYDNKKSKIKTVTCGV